MHRFQELGCSSLLEKQNCSCKSVYGDKTHRDEAERSEAESRCGFVAEPSRSEGDMAWETVRGIIIKIKKAAHMGSLFEMKRRVLWQRHIYQSVRITKKQF